MEMIIHYLVLALLFIVSLVVFINFGKCSNVKKAILFALLFGLIFTSFGFFAKVPSMANTMTLFIIIQIISLGLGYLLFILLKRNYFGEMNKENTGRVSLVIMFAALGMLGFSILYNFLNSSVLGAYFSLSIIIFILPQLISLSFNSYISIPEEIHKIWYFPINGEDIDFDNIDTNTIYMLELEYSKSKNDDRLINTKLRAPLNMKFGDWFRSFIENYNEKYENDPIHFTNDDQSPQGWMFYIKPSFFGGTKFIDPELTIKDNKIIEKNIILAKRVGIS